MNKFQLHYIEKLRLAGKWNSFDGEAVANALIKNQHLYTNFIFNKDLFYLIELRDLEISISADTLWFLAPEANYLLLRKLLKKYNANEFGCINRDNELHGVIPSVKIINRLFCSRLRTGEMIMRVWWD